MSKYTRSECWIGAGRWSSSCARTKHVHKSNKRQCPNKQSSSTYDQHLAGNFGFILANIVVHQSSIAVRSAKEITVIQSRSVGRRSIDQPSVSVSINVGLHRYGDSHHLIQFQHRNKYRCRRLLSTIAGTKATTSHLFDGH